MVTEGLLERAAAGDGDAFAALFAQCERPLRRLVDLRVGGELNRRCSASDVIQETQLTAFRRLEEFVHARPMPFTLWLRRLALQQISNLRRHHVRAAKRSVRREQHGPDRSSVVLAESLAESGVTPSGVLAAREEIQRLQAAMAELSETDREILLLRYVERHTNQEVALLLDISENAASKRHGAALLRLRKIMKGQFPEG